MIPRSRCVKRAFSVFIRHAKSDVKEAEAIAAALEERGLKCWIARRGARLRRRDHQGHREIRVVSSSFFRKRSNGSAFVAREVERAVSKQKPIFAVRLADVVPAPALELFISGTQWIDAFPGSLAPHIGRLAKLLGEDEVATRPLLTSNDADRPMPVEVGRCGPSRSLSAPTRPSTLPF